MAQSQNGRNFYALPPQTKGLVGPTFSMFEINGGIIARSRGLALSLGLCPTNSNGVHALSCWPTRCSALWTRRRQKPATKRSSRLWPT
jgi:hypothetical protein